MIHAVVCIEFDHAFTSNTMIRAILILALLIPAALFAQSDIIWMKGGHTDAVTGLEFSPDSRTIASVGLDGKMRFWDPASGNLLHTVRTMHGVVYALAWSPDGSSVITAGVDGAIRFWNPSTYDNTATLRDGLGAIYAIAVSSDGTRLAAGHGSGDIVIWDLTSGETVDTLSGHGSVVNGVAFSPDGEYLASVGDDFATILWNARTGELLHKQVQGQFAPKAVTFSPDGSTLAVPVETHVGLFSVPLLNQVGNANNDHSVTIHDIAYSPDGGLLASGSEDLDVAGSILKQSIEVSDLNGDKSTFERQYPPTIGYPTSIDFSPDGQLMAWGTNLGTIHLGAIATASTPTIFGSEPEPITGHHTEIPALAFSSDGRYLASGGADDVVRLWNPSNGSLLRVLEGHEGTVTSVAFSRDNTKVASSSADGTVRIWDVATGELQTTVFVTPHYAATSTDFSPDGTHVIAGIGFSDSTAAIWDTTELLPVRRLDGHSSAVTAVAWSPTLDRVITGSDDRTVRLWKASDGSPLGVLQKHAAPITDVAIADDGREFASSSSDGTVIVWDAASGDYLRTVDAHDQSANAIAIGPDGDLIAAAGGDRTVRIFDGTSDQVHQYDEYDAEQLSIAMNLDSLWVASGTDDGTIILWRLHTVAGVDHTVTDRVASMRAGAPWPNPSTGRVAVPVELTHSARLRVTVYDALGMTAIPTFAVSAPAGETTIRLDTGSLPGGEYFCRIDDGATGTSVHFVIVRGQ